MTILIVLAALTVAGSLGTVATVIRDGYRAVPVRTSTDRIRPA